jgi:hypothetical protein
MMQADGTRKFIGNEKDMQNAIKDTIEATREKAEENRKLAEGVKDKKIDYEITDEEVEKAAGGDGKDGKFRF